MGKNNENQSPGQHENHRKPQSQYCAALNCCNSRATKCRMSFFRFPKDQARCKKWIENCRRVDLNSKDPEVLYRSFVFCADHFEDSQFMNAATKNKLVWNAIPTLFNVPDPPPSIAEEKARGCPLFPPSPELISEDDYRSVPVLLLAQIKAAKAQENGSSVTSAAADTEAEVGTSEMDDGQEGGRPISTPASDVPTKRRKRLAAAVLTPQQLRRIKSKQLINRQRIKIWRLKKQVQALKAKVKSCDTVDDVVQLASKYVSGVALSFFANQMRVACKKNHGKRWTREDKFFALVLSLTSAEAYRLCSKVFSLPSLRTLQRWVKGFKQEADFEEQLRVYKENLLKNTDEDNSSLLQKALPNVVDPSSNAISPPAVPNTALMPLDSSPFNLQPLFAADDNVAVTESLFRETTDMPSSEISALNVSLPILDASSLVTRMDEDTVPSDSNTSETCNGSVVTKKSHAATELKLKQSELQHLELFTSLTAAMDAVPPSEDAAQCYQLQLDTDQLDPETLRLLTGSGHLGSGTSTSITAVQEINPEGMVTLTPLSNGVPVTLSGDTINLKIVTLDMPDHTLGSFELT